MNPKKTEFADKALGDAIKTQSARIDEAKRKKSSLQELYEQLQAVGEEAIVTTSKSTGGEIRITVKCNTVVEELEVLMGMSSVYGEITYNEYIDMFTAELEYSYNPQL